MGRAEVWAASFEANRPVTFGRSRFTACRPLHVPVRIEGILFDRATPWELKVLTVKRAL